MFSRSLATVSCSFLLFFRSTTPRRRPECWEDGSYKQVFEGPITPSTPWLRYVYSKFEFAPVNEPRTLCHRVRRPAYGILPHFKGRLCQHLAGQPRSSPCCSDGSRFRSGRLPRMARRFASGRWSYGARSRGAIRRLEPGNGNGREVERRRSHSWDERVDPKLGLNETKGDYSGKPDDRWIFTTNNPFFQWNAIAALAAAADTLKGWDDCIIERLSRDSDQSMERGEGSPDASRRQLRRCSGRRFRRRAGRFAGCGGWHASQS
jgi:hypothetical protein